MTEADHAAGVETDRAVIMLEAIEECGKLAPEEKETFVRFSKADSVAHVYTEYRVGIRRLLLHREFEVEELRVCGPEDHSYSDKRENRVTTE